MKRLLTIALCLSLLLCGCGGEEPAVTEVSTTEPAATATVITDDVKAQLDAVLEKHNFEGIVSLTHHGEVVYSSVTGTNDLGEPLTMDSPMYIGSMSKQFCATAILQLRDQGKLSLEDPLSMYFPECTYEQTPTLKHLLTMRSGLQRDITPMWEEPEAYINKTDAENWAFCIEWVFSQPLKFEPGSRFDYSNVNYTLLSRIVESISEQAYEDYIRQNILEPVGMSHTGFVDEIPSQPDWAKGLNNENLLPVDRIQNSTQGCGDLATTSVDFHLWMTALRSGQVISEETYQEMTTNYTPEQPHIRGYGYGLEGAMRNGWGHGGNIGNYSSYGYFFPESGYQIYMVTGNTPSFLTNPAAETYSELIKAVFAAVDAAN